MDIEQLGALRILPPIIAIGLAIWWRNVLPALFAGIWTGTTILAQGNPWIGLRQMIDPLAIDQLADRDHVKVILFTLSLGAMVGVITRNGGSRAVVDAMSHYVRGRRGGQVMTWLCGMLVFFDDYANALLIGGTMRPVTDRLRISREKLAFLIDSTAAPVAGVAIISTWVLTEIDWIKTSFDRLGQTQVDVGQIFLDSIPYRFYPLAMLLFVFVISVAGRDFGAMLKAEEKCLNGKLPDDEHESATSSFGGFKSNALIPLGVLLLISVYGFIFHRKESTDWLVLAAFLASTIAILVTIISRSLSVKATIDAWVEGLTHMVPAMVILALAWMLGGICSESHLNSGDYLRLQVGDSIAIHWMPTITFVLSAGVAFATGSSYATMGLLFPPMTALAWGLLGDSPAPDDSIMLATIGAVLAGSIWGDHCSPISDTTVLSSAAAKCDHLDHVATQMPYALAVGAISIVCGWIPIGF
ncbi:MAG TPA: Na+/H+ antiporter NhaC family protein, partial [Planctomycetaceae bacterium]|nr:Na+/H+ antiporter NhaC family protein [Planctomycetaceae bacterium]